MGRALISPLSLYTIGIQIVIGIQMTGEVLTVFKEIERTYKYVTTEIEGLLHIVETCPLCGETVISTDTSFKIYKKRLICQNCFYRLKNAEKLLEAFYKLPQREYKVNKPEAKK